MNHTDPLGRKMMKERPILFSAPMVRAILDGSKTQTRRIVKLPHQNPLGQWEQTTIGGPNGGRTAEGATIPEKCAIWHTRTGDVITCKSQPMERLWVRETWRGVVKISPPNAAMPEYGVARYVPDEEHCKRVEYAATQEQDSEPWRPSIHMPRWASRILLEVTNVRVERLQDISEADAVAEGTPCYVCGGAMDGRSEDDCHCFHRKATASDYRNLWESINGAGSWDANPWVWVIEFRRIGQLKAAA